MTKPIFKMPKIQHKSVKHRKEFIEDMLFINIAKAILTISHEQDFTNDEEVITFHKNRYRKQLKKIKEVSEFINLKAEAVLDMLDRRDIVTLDHKTKQCSTIFILTMAKAKKASLELIAVALLDMALRRKRKTPLREELKVFTDYSLLYGKLGKAVEDAGVREMSEEMIVAEELINKIDYRSLK